MNNKNKDEMVKDLVKRIKIAEAEIKGCTEELNRHGFYWVEQLGWVNIPTKEE